MKFFKNMVMNQASGMGGEGGGAGGGENNANNQNQGGEFKGPAWAKDLKLEGLEDDILTDPSLGPITNISSLMKSYVHAQRSIGKKSSPIPTETSTKEEWDTFYQKMGIPLDEKAWGEKFKPSKETALDENLQNEYAKKAHELRVSPEKAQQLFELFGSQSKAISERFVTETKAKAQGELDAYRDELGQDAYNVKVAKATRMVTEVVGKEFMEYLGTSGLGKNVHIVKALTKIADKYMGEQKIEGGDNQSGMTLDEIEKSINGFMADLKGPYFTPSHPDHSRTVNEVQRLFALQAKNSK